jgi:VWFA-related protein
MVLRTWPLAVSVLASVAVLHGRQSQAPAPTFRSGVDLVTIDVSVLDRSRQPIRGLTAADFTVLDGGVERPIASFKAIDLPDRRSYPAPWMHDVVPDVSNNRFEADRIVVLLLDDFNVAVSPADMNTARTVAHGIIDELGPSDLGAVVYTFFHQHDQEFTSDHARLKASVDRFVGFGGQPPMACPNQECVTGAMRAIADVLRQWPERRKTIAFIGPEAKWVIGPQNIEQGQSETNATAIDSSPELTRTFKALQTANVNVYQYDTRGLMGSLDLMQQVGMFADATGGRTVTRTNDPERRVSEMFVENSSYYLIGFEPAAPLTAGGYRPIRVTVNRPDVTVRTRGGYFGDNVSVEKAPKKAPPPTALDSAMAGAAPTGDLPLTLTVAPFARDGDSRATVAIVAGLDRPASLAGKDTVTIAARAFDESKVPRASNGVAKSTLVLTPRSGDRDTHYDVATTLDLKPGDYEIRLAMESTTSAVKGSAFMSVTVPDFQKDPLSLSGVVLTRVPAARASGRNPLAEVLPFTPTTVRTFTRGERVSLLTRIYQGGKDPAQPVDVAVAVIDRVDKRVYENTMQLPASVFGTKRSGELGMPLPLETLEPGPYLLAIEATAGKATKVRHVRFEVE